VNRVDVGGYTLGYRRWSAGYPVVFVSALGTRGSDWAATVYHMTEPVDAFTYNRAGIGGSDARPDRGPHGPRALADELQQILTALDVPRPAVFVGHSVGAHVVRVYAADHPGEVSGIVLVDPSFDDLVLLPGDDQVWSDGGLDTRSTLIDAQLCAAELRDAPPLPRVPAAVVSRTSGRWYEPHLCDTPGLTERWDANQRRLAQLLGARHYTSVDSDHLITEEDPELVAQAVDEVVRQVRET
jgi:pimeloyl-ACP methyl ester carboxylesterase